MTTPDPIILLRRLPTEAEFRLTAAALMFDMVAGDARSGRPLHSIDIAAWNLSVRDVAFAIARGEA